MLLHLLLVAVKSAQKVRPVAPILAHVRCLSSRSRGCRVHNFIHQNAKLRLVFNSTLSATQKVFVAFFLLFSPWLFLPFDLYKTSRRIAPIFQNPKVGCRYVIRALDPVEELFFARGSVRTADAAIA